MRYDKYRWDEDRGDQFASWGRSWWYFEFGPDGYVRRQMEVYDSGVRIRYGPDNQEDDFGGLGQVHESEMDHSADSELTAEDFDAMWEQGPWHNEPLTAK
jgi:hypothetical protein